MVWQLRRGTPAQAVASARVLLDGELAITRAGTGKGARLLVGDGATAVEDLIPLVDAGVIQQLKASTVATDNAPRMQAQIDAAPVGTVFVMPPGGPYLIRDTLRLGARRRIMGGASNYGSEIRAGISGLPIMMTMDSGAVVEDITFNGANLASWGLKIAPSANKIHQQRVRAENCTGAGFVYEGAQNSVAIDCFAQYNLVNYLLVNGVANTKFLNCNANLPSTAGAGARSVLIANSTDSRLTGQVYADGNRAISFIGGILERGTDDHCQFEILDASGYVSLTEMEFNSQGEQAIHVGPGTTGSLLLNRATFALNGTNLAVRAESGNVHSDHCTYTGSGGRVEGAMFEITGTAAWTQAIDSGSVMPNILGTASSFFRSGIGSWLPSGGGGASWDANNWRLIVTSSSPAQGARCSFPGAQGSVIAAGRRARIQFYIESVTGAADVSLRATTATSNKPLNTPGTYGIGEHTVITTLDGDETGFLFGAGSAVASAIKIGYMTVNII